MQLATFRILEKEDLPQIINLMVEVKAPISGIKSPKVYDRFCHYSIKTDKVVFAIAELDDRIVGFSITIIDWKRFWREFLICHPMIICKIIMNKIIKLFNINGDIRSPIERADISKYLTTCHTNRSWNDSSPFIAKVLYVAVKNDYRKRGIGKGLYDFRTRILLKKGVKRLDSKINHQNIAPIKLAYNEGRKIIRERDGMLFTTMDL